MRRIIFLILILCACLEPLGRTQAPAASPPPELQKWNLWVGDWTLEGTAKDTGAEPEYKLDWRMQGRWILGGHFVDVRGIWRGKGAESVALEIGSYDRGRRIYAISGFADDGTTWVGTVTFSDGISIETGTDTGPDGKTTKWVRTWSVSPDGMSISGREEREQDGVRWTSFRVKGTKTNPVHTQGTEEGYLTGSDGNRLFYRKLGAGQPTLVFLRRTVWWLSRPPRFGCERKTTDFRPAKLSPLSTLI